MKLKFMVVISDITTSFLISCFLTVLLFVFNDSSSPITPVDVRQVIGVLFIFFLTMVIINGCFLNTERWFTLPLKKEELGPSYIPGKVFVETNTYLKYLEETSPAYSVKIIAVHEAGHAIMAYLNKDRIDSFKVIMDNIRPQTAIIYSNTDASMLKMHILVCYAGAAAEELLLGHMCPVSVLTDSSDFNQARELIKAYIIMTDQSVSKSLLESELSGRIIRLSNELYEKTKSVLSKNLDMLQALSDEMAMRGNTIKSDEIISILSGVQRERMSSTICDTSEGEGSE